VTSFAGGASRLAALVVAQIGRRTETGRGVSTESGFGKGRVISSLFGAFSDGLWAPTVLRLASGPRDPGWIRSLEDGWGVCRDRMPHQDPEVAALLDTCRTLLEGAPNRAAHRAPRRPRESVTGRGTRRTAGDRDDTQGHRADRHDADAATTRPCDRCRRLRYSAIVRAFPKRQTSREFAAGETDRFWPTAPALIRILHDLLRDGGLPRVRFHDLRHSAASLLIAEGVQLVEVSMLLGHSETRVTSDIYGHLQKQTAAKAVRRMEAVLGAAEA
jgi:hypothetical protein